MFDIMLIDDDVTSRQALKQNIHWDKVGARLLCEAEDSETATELYLLYRPKIIIADMSTPLLFGLELAANLQKEDQDIQFIIITDYDFDFTKHPLDLRTVSILRKPVRAQDLNYSITKAVRQLEVDRERKAASAGLDQIYNIEKSLKGPVIHFKYLEKLGVLSHYPVYDNIRNLFRQRRLEELKQFLLQPGNLSIGEERLSAFLFEYIAIITSEALHAGLETGQLEGCAGLLIKVFQAENPESSLEAVVEMTERLMKQLEKQCSTNTNQLITIAKSYIEENMGNDQLNLEKVSNFVGLSRIYFCKRFHQSEGISFSNYLKDVRIKKAKKLLTQTNMKVFEVGSAVGFSNPKYFSYVFKQATGQTPLEFQKKVQEG